MTGKVSKQRWPNGRVELTLEGIKLMKNFIDIDSSQTLTVDEYLSSVLQEERRNAVAEMLDVGLQLLELMKSNSGVAAPAPEIFVKTTSHVGAEASPFGVIIITIGMIDHCLDTPWPQPHLVLGMEAPVILGLNLIAQLGLAWVIGHEFTHLFRHHHEVEGKLGSSLAVQRALEHDADLCSTAGIFRLMQRLFGGIIPDIAIRRYTVFALFWIIRTIPETNNGAGSHPSFSERFFHITLKLITLQENRSETYDPTVNNQLSLDRCNALVSASIRCEKTYQEINGISDGGYFTEWLEYFENNNQTEIIWDWVAISPWVEHFSGTAADMRPQLTREEREEALVRGLNLYSEE
ncbi:hypothetical protein K3169_04815 [Pseudomonas phytophila]|uniref:Peptidase M48 domain-containing protein n=1 Tax=Pseudomonas phytophila TaxID=2867264 RepID=A0ABY6FHF6_9PSED|nr:hypothetical protein [Pseudomonas phytophila]UXZ97231.1 hypothetical protein K3169_04815 [Pseudomonas phytophila]